MVPSQSIYSSVSTWRSIVPIRGFGGLEVTPNIIFKAIISRLEARCFKVLRHDLLGLLVDLVGDFVEVEALQRLHAMGGVVDEGLWLAVDALGCEQRPDHFQ
eukprot:scaffold1016_cov175-Ochromonas_danica.AAC.19